MVDEYLGCSKNRGALEGWYLGGHPVSRSTPVKGSPTC